MGSVAKPSFVPALLHKEHMPKERCEEQAKLALAAVAAINRVHDLKKELDSARKRKLDTEPYDIALHDAREVEWHAIAALENHKRQHRCWGIGLPRSAP
jgi:hypothetical protein